MPLYVEPEWRTFRLLAIDPGKHNIGISIHELDTRTGEYVKITIESMDVDRTLARFGASDEVVSVSDRCLRKIRDRIYDLVIDYDISFVAYESPFYNPTRPAAYGSLCEVVACIRQAVIDANPNVYIDCMSPQNIKKGMGAGGTKGKEIMFEKVLGTKEMMDALDCDISELTEHCIDSMAIGYNARNTIIAPMEGWKL